MSVDGVNVERGRMIVGGNCLRASQPVGAREKWHGEYERGLTKEVVEEDVSKDSRSPFRCR